jgi:hypothetical protein
MRRKIQQIQNRALHYQTWSVSVSSLLFRVPNLPSLLTSLLLPSAPFLSSPSVAEVCKVKMDDLYKMFCWDLYKKYGHAYEAFKAAVT